MNSHGKSEIVLNKAYNERAEHYGVALLPCCVRAPKDKEMVEEMVGAVSNFILATLSNMLFLYLNELNEAIPQHFIFKATPHRKYGIAKEKLV